jgi:hypothetical protein
MTSPQARRAASLSLLALVLAAFPPRAASQFTQITADFMAGVADVEDGFGAEDKAVVCNGDFVFIDLDENVADVWRYKYASATDAWSKDALTALDCPDSGQGGLVPRDTGYVVSTTAGPYGGDRLLILGGATDNNGQDENNVCMFTLPQSPACIHTTPLTLLQTPYFCRLLGRLRRHLDVLRRRANLATPRVCRRRPAAGRAPLQPDGHARRLR